MRKLLCIGVILCMILTMSACDLIDQIHNQVDNLGNNLHSGLNGNTVQSLLEQGFSSLQDMFKQNIIESTGELTENTVHEMHIYEDKIVLNISTDNAVQKMKDEGVTIEKIQDERADAETAQMEYILQYQFCAEFKVNGETKIGVGAAPATENTLPNTLEMTIPIPAEHMGVTIYELLQGGFINIETRLQHGTATTKIYNNTYFVNELPSGANGTILTLIDHRTGK